MSERELRIGLVGCGGIGDCHLKCWAKQEGARIAATCDIVPERAEKFAAQFGAQAFTDMAEMLEKAELDAVDICTPSGLHAQQGLMAIEAGKHVLVEKPIDIDIRKVDALLEAAERSGLVLACIFQNRIGPEIQRAKQLIDEGKLGKLISGSTYIKWWRSQDYYSADDWRGTWQLDGGVFSNQAIHAIDQLCWLCGPVREVEYSHIETAMHDIEAEDFGIGVLAFENGARGVVEATTCCYPGMSMKTEIFGTLGSAVFEGSRVTMFKVQGEEIDLTSGTPEQGDGRSDPMAIGLGGHAAQIMDFCNCIWHGGEPIVSGRSARVSVDTLTKLYNRAGVTKLGT